MAATYAPATLRDLESRFWSKVDRSGACWLWNASRTTAGYGGIRAGRRGSPLLMAHRVSFALHNGPIPGGHEVCHVCDNPPCVNPAHLFLGSHTDNMRDMTEKGRRRDDATLPRGSAHHSAVLDEAAVVELRRRRKDGATYGELMALSGLSKSSVASLVNYETWRHVQ